MLDELFYEYDFNDVDYCQSVINSATLIKQNYYELTDESVNNVLKYHNGSSFITIASGLTNIIEDQTPELYAALDCNDKNLTEVATISGDNLQIDFGAIA